MYSAGTKASANSTSRPSVLVRAFRALVAALVIISSSLPSALSIVGTQLPRHTHRTLFTKKMTAISSTTRHQAAVASSSTAAAASAAEKLKVAIIGAGAAGLTAARQFTRQGIEPTILEQDSMSGGVWNYVPNAPDRPMYRGLRTNLPRELMAFREKPWGGDGTTKSYVTHGQVLDYLREYSEEFDLQRYISYGCTVCQVTMQSGDDGNEPSAAAVPDGEAPWPKIRLAWDSATDQSRHSDTFDAVCVCNGHYAVASKPIVPGLEENFKGRTMHSVEYDDPSLFKGKNVLCIGGRASGSDLAREISRHAAKVYLSDSACKKLEDGQPRTDGNVNWVPRTMSVDDTGSIHFEGCNDTPSDIDVIIYCSGYDYNFPFLNEKSNLDVKCVKGERRVAPLYEQMWHARYPNLSFVGLQHSIVPFPFFELQTQAVVATLVGKAAVPLPKLEKRISAAEADAKSGGPNDPGRVEDTHFLGSHQWDASRTYARIAGVYDEETEDYIATNKAIYDHSGSRRKGLFPGGRDTYREDIYVRDDKRQGFDVKVAEHIDQNV